MTVGVCYFQGVEKNDNIYLVPGAVGRPFFFLVVFFFLAILLR